MSASTRATSIAELPAATALLPSDCFGTRLSRTDAERVLDRTIHTLPSPILPVRAASITHSATVKASVSSTRISIFTFGTKSIVYSAPRYTSVCPRWRPKPCACVPPQTLHADAQQRGLHVVELERLDDPDDELHAGPPCCVTPWSRSPLGERISGFGVFAEVEPRVLLFVIDPHAARQQLVEEEHDREGDDERVDERYRDGQPPARRRVPNRRREIPRCGPPAFTALSAKKPSSSDPTMPPTR